MFVFFKLFTGPSDEPKQNKIPKHRKPTVSPKDRKASSRTVDEIGKSDMDQTDSQSQGSPPVGPAEDYVILPNVPHLVKFEKLGEPAAELENFYKDHPILLTEDYVSVREGVEDTTEETKWVNLSPRKDYYSTDKVRRLLLEQKMPKKNLWRGTLVHGIPEEWRGSVWCYFSKAEEIAGRCAPNMYQSLLTRPDPDVEASIEKDLTRTFPDIPEFKEPGSSGKNRLYNVLKAYAQYDFKVGYCQGLNYVAAMLLLYINKEELAFFTLVHIMYNFEWRMVYVENMPKLTTLLKVLSKEVKRRLPEVYGHLKSLEIDLSGLFSHIFLTVFIYRTPFELAVKIFDLFMLEKEKALITAAVNMLRIMKDKIISYNSMDVHQYIKGQLSEDCLKNAPIEDILKPLS